MRRANKAGMVTTEKVEAEEAGIVSRSSFIRMRKVRFHFNEPTLIEDR